MDDRFTATFKTHRVLEIGTGSGYQAAVLSRLIKSVYSIELVPQLARSAAKRSAQPGYRNVAVREGNGYQGWPAEAPFDRIVLTSAPADIPKALADQLAPGGRLVAPVGKSCKQSLIVVDKTRTGSTDPLRETNRICAHGAMVEGYRTSGKSGNATPFVATIKPARVRQAI